MEKAVQLAEDLGVRKFVTEFWYQGKENWKEDLLFANKAMRTLLDVKEN